MTEQDGGAAPTPWQTQPPPLPPSELVPPVAEISAAPTDEYSDGRVRLGDDSGWTEGHFEVNQDALRLVGERGEDLVHVPIGWIRGVDEVGQLPSGHRTIELKLDTGALLLAGMRNRTVEELLRACEAQQPAASTPTGPPQLDHAAQNWMGVKSDPGFTVIPVQPWYRRPVVLLGAALLLVVAAFGVGFLVRGGGNPETAQVAPTSSIVTASTSTSISTTSVPTTTTVPTTSTTLAPLTVPPTFQPPSAATSAAETAFLVELTLTDDPLDVQQQALNIGNQVCETTRGLVEDLPLDSDINRTLAANVLRSAVINSDVAAGNKRAFVRIAVAATAHLCSQYESVGREAFGTA